MHWSWLAVVAGIVVAALCINHVARKGVVGVGDIAFHAYRHVRRLVVLLVGSTVVAVGVIMLVTPGPAVVVIPLGLGILSTEFIWARRLLKRVKDMIVDTAKSIGGDDPKPEK